VIDADGYRANVGIIVSSSTGKVLWARRVGGKDAWQFPQGGIKKGETHEQALYRELSEEIGLTENDVEIVSCTRGWLRYQLPRRLIRYETKPLCIGQKQIWYLLRLTSDDGSVALANCQKPEFDHWRWVDYWLPLREVVSFKRKVYEMALKEFEPLLFPEQDTQKKLRRRGPYGLRR